MLLFELASRIETVEFKLAEGKGLREAWDSRGVWKSVEKVSVGKRSPECSFRAVQCSLRQQCQTERFLPSSICYC